MKVGIITINDAVNIGNRLQNYAVQEILKEHGHEVYTLIYDVYDDEAKGISKIKIFLDNLMVKSGFSTSDIYIKKVKKNPKMLLVKKFNMRYINTTRKKFLKIRWNENSDYFCVGSDQVWHSSRVQNRGFFFLHFAKSEKTFSFAASMGTTYIAEKYKENFKQGFRHVGHISVREDSVQKLIKDMVDRDVTVLLDPTLLIDKERWVSVTECPKVDLPKKYIVTYFLSEITVAQLNFIQKYANEKGVGVVDINGEYEQKVGPSEFLYLMSHAEFVFTDSFHGTAFSIVFEKPFIVFQRNNIHDMSSRVVTILKKFDILKRFPKCDNTKIDASFYGLLDEISAEDTSHFQEILEKEKKTMNDFLEKVFRDKEGVIS